MMKEGLAWNQDLWLRWLTPWLTWRSRARRFSHGMMTSFKKSQMIRFSQIISDKRMTFNRLFSELISRNNKIIHIKTQARTRDMASPAQVDTDYQVYQIFQNNIFRQQNKKLNFYKLIIIPMGNTCMGNPRKGNQIMKQKSLPQARYANYESNKEKKELVVGEVEGAHIKISKSLLTCTICMQNYNTTKREPVIACSNHHTYCRECMEAAGKYKQNCPECRNQLLPLSRNRDIYQLIQDNMKQLESDKLQVIKEDGSSFIPLTVNPKNKFIDNFWIEGNKIMKIDDNMIWEGFVSNETMHRDRESIFTVKVVLSKFNNIEIGIVGAGYQTEKNITCKESVVYHLADGMVLEGLPGRGSQWRHKGTKIVPGKSITIEVRVNIPSKTIAWYQSDQQLGHARLSDYLIQHQCVAYVMMSHKDDIVQLNA